MLLFKLIRRELRHMLHPRSVGVVKLEGKRVDNATLNGVSAYFPIYFAFIAGIFLILSLEPNFNIESNLSATVSCFNNIGPGLGLVGRCKAIPDTRTCPNLFCPWQCCWGGWKFSRFGLHSPPPPGQK